MPQPQDFTHDVFLSHSAKDKAVVRAVAERLRTHGLKVWFDEGELPKAEGRRQKDEIGIQPSSFFLHPSLEEGLDHSEFGFRISDLRSPACRRMRSARTGRTCG